MNIVTDLTGKEKAANVLIMLGKDASAKIMSYLDEDEIRKITYEIVNNKTVDKDDRINILKEFYHVCLAQTSFSEGGVEYAREVLTETLGPQRSMELITDLINLNKAKPFDFVKDLDVAEVFNFIQHESDQTIAFILSYLKSKQSAALMSMLPPERQSNIAVKIALMDKISPDVIADIEKVMQQRFVGSVSTSFTKMEGVEVLVNIMNSVDRGTEKQIFEELAKEDETLVDEIKTRMFVFEDIINLGPKEVQRFLADVETEDIAVSLKVATDEVKDLILSNLSKRIKDVVIEEMDLMGPVRLSEVEKSQQKLVNVIRKLDEKGEIFIRKTGGDTIIE